MRGEINMLNKAKERNLIVKLFKAYRKDETILNRELTEQELQEHLFFKKGDMARAQILANNNSGYIITEQALKNLKIIIRKNEEAIQYLVEHPEIEDEFKQLYSEIKKSFNDHGYKHEERQLKFKRAIEIAEILHWKYVPVYGEQMMVNRRVVPEGNIVEYYSSFHALEDLYREIIGEGKNHATLEGDINLNKKLSFRVYTSRFGHDDVYNMKRTTDGWYVEHISINGPSDKCGKGALKENLRHDGVIYYEEGVESALEILWNEADSTTMSIDELQVKLQQIADWISEMERARSQHQPEWSIC